MREILVPKISRIAFAFTVKKIKPKRQRRTFLLYIVFGRSLVSYKGVSIRNGYDGRLRFLFDRFVYQGR